MPPLQNPNSYPAPTPGDNGQSPYDFFMDGGNNSPRNAMPAGKRLAMAIALIVGVLSVLALVLALISNSGKEAPQLVTIVQSQQEIARISKEGFKSAQNPKVKSFSITASATLTSAQQDMTAYLNKNGVKIGKGDLASPTSDQTDKALAAAVTASTFDSTYSAIMQSELNTYEKRLESATAVSVSESERSMLQKYTIGAQLLRTQLTSP